MLEGRPVFLAEKTQLTCEARCCVVLTGAKHFVLHKIFSLHGRIQMLDQKKKETLTCLFGQGY